MTPCPATAHLDPEVVYRAPSGRMCRLFGVENAGPEGVTARLVYVSGRGHRAAVDWAGDGFVLARENWRLLQVVR